MSINYLKLKKILTYIGTKYYRKNLIDHFLKLYYSNKYMAEIDEYVYKYAFYLLKNNPNNFLDSLTKLLKDYILYYNKLLTIIKYYNYDFIDPLIDTSFRFNDFFIYSVYYDDLLNHYNTSLYKFFITNEFIDFFSIGFRKFFLKIHVEDNSLLENSLSIGIVVYIPESKIRLHNVCFYLGIDRIFISSVQYFKPYYEYYNHNNMLHNYIFQLVSIIGKKIGIEKIITYSDYNHCLSHQKDFYGIYNNIFSKRGFNLDDRKFFNGDIYKLSYRNVGNDSFNSLKKNLFNFLNKYDK